MRRNIDCSLGACPNISFRCSERRLDENGWSLEGSDFDAGELALRARRGEIEMVVELGQEDELVEIKMELPEPLSS